MKDPTLTIAGPPKTRPVEAVVRWAPRPIFERLRSSVVGDWTRCGTLKGSIQREFLWRRVPDRGLVALWGWRL